MTGLDVAAPALFLGSKSERCFFQIAFSSFGLPFSATYRANDSSVRHDAQRSRRRVMAMRSKLHTDQARMIKPLSIRSVMLAGVPV
jgi:hypothetical protein